MLFGRFPLTRLEIETDSNVCMYCFIAPDYGSAESKDKG